MIKMVNQDITIGASAGIFKPYIKEILLTKRANNMEKFPGYWTFPGGVIERIDKDVEATVKREVKEEVGLEFFPLKKFGFYESRWKGKRVISLVFLGEWQRGKIKIQKEEIDAFEWCTYEEAIQFKLAFAYKQVIEDLHHKGLL